MHKRVITSHSQESVQEWQRSNELQCHLTEYLRPNIEIADFAGTQEQIGSKHVEAKAGKQPTWRFVVDAMEQSDLCVWLKAQLCGLEDPGRRSP